MIICGTGHRPAKLGGYTQDVFDKLVALAEWYILNQLDNLDSPHTNEYISGMALGWDMALAQACVNLNVKWTAAIPFVGQESRWPKSSQDAYNGLLVGAMKIHIVSPGEYAAWKMHKRNEWMIDHSDRVVALYDGDPIGGTAACLHYAESQGKTVDNLWDKWMEMNDEDNGFNYQVDTHTT